MSQNFAHFVGKFGIHNPIILDSFKFAVPLLLSFAGVGYWLGVQLYKYMQLLVTQYSSKFYTLKDRM